VQIEESDYVHSLISYIYGRLDTHYHGLQNRSITFKLTTTMFKLQTITVLFSLAAQGLSIGCEYIGLDAFKENSTGKVITQLDPLVESEEFDIIDPYKCSFRFHTPQDRKATLENIQDFSEEFRRGK
jgi:hypothetical protein